MFKVSSRELRNNTASVLNRVDHGEEAVVTVHGRQVAALIPLQRGRKTWLGHADLVKILRISQADPGLREDLARLTPDTTDDLGPIL
ncbi:MAG TPA: type II toxin-antitoxin system prevent-host-death family antitoxin [Mycobacteriales bacterium]|nr:type II toxin-antitoxin system prevent-host-death family antitoxin [Mycobacteriales bacterium]